jgi:hypothetical protein
MHFSSEFSPEKMAIPFGLLSITHIFLKNKSEKTGHT